MEFFFYTIHKFYEEGKFLDLKLISGIDSTEVCVHSVIIASAIPELGRVLKEHLNDKLNEESVLLFPECSGNDLKQVVSEIYSALIQEINVDDDKTQFWCNTLCVKNFQKVEASKPVRVSKRTIKKRKVFDPDFDYGSTKKPRTGLNQKPVPKLASKVVKIKEEIDIYEIVKDEIEDNDESADFDISREELDEDEDPEFVVGPKMRTPIKPRIRPKEKSHQDFEAAFKAEITEERHDVKRVILPLSVSFEGQLTTIQNVSEFKKFSSGNATADANVEHFFTATAGDNILIEENIDVQPEDVRILPKDNLVGLFAVGVVDGQNVAHPLLFPTDDIEVNCTKFVQLIRHVTGTSVRDVIGERLSALLANDDNPTVEEMEEKLPQLVSREIGEIRLKNIQFHLKNNTKTKRMSAWSFPDPGSSVRFRLVCQLPTNKVANYVIVRGNDVESLTVQTLIKVSLLGPLDKSKTISTLLNVTAEFCGLDSSDDLYNVAYFKDLLEENFKRSCEKYVLDKLAARPKESVSLCPFCKKAFPVTTAENQKQFLAHRLAHTGCGCEISFTSNAEYRSHIKKVHIGPKESFRCPEEKCNARFKTETALDKHVSMRHKKTVQNGTGVMCDTCGKLIRNQSIKHSYSVDPEEARCTRGRCGQVFTKQSSLDAHISKVHERTLEGGTGVICDICGEAYFNRRFLNRHHYLSHKSLKCPGCKEIIPGGSRAMYNHRAKECQLTMPTLCPICGQAFKMRMSLTNHIRITHMDDKEKFPCELCPKKFACKQRLDVHMNGVHNTEKMYPCRAGPVCNVKFTTTASRKRHEMKQHSLDIRLKPGGPKNTMVPAALKLDVDAD